MKFVHALMLLFLSLLTSHCRDSKQASSKLDWAHLPLSPRYQNWLINVPPRQTIRVCGSDQDLTIWAIKTWAAVINRDAHLNVVPCDRGPGAAATVRVDREYCEGIAFADPDTRHIKICPGIASIGFDYSHVILHEVGHLWGLCDLYTPNLYYCDQTYNDGPDQLALMMGGAGTARQIQQDDAEGLMVLSQRPEFPANHEWQAFLQNSSLSGQGTSTCTFGGVEHDTGSVIYDAGQMMKCQDGRWIPAVGSQARNCRHGGREYKADDVIYDGANFLSCTDGTWKRLKLAMATNLCQVS